MDDTMVGRYLKGTRRPDLRGTARPNFMANLKMAVAAAGILAAIAGVILSFSGMDGRLQWVPYVAGVIGALLATREMWGHRDR